MTSTTTLPGFVFSLRAPSSPLLSTCRCISALFLVPSKEFLPAARSRSPSGDGAYLVMYNIATPRIYILCAAVSVNFIPALHHYHHFQRM